MSPSTTTDLPGDGRRNFVTWIDGSDLYNAGQLEILDIYRILKKAPIKPFSVRRLSNSKKLVLRCNVCSVHCSYQSYIFWRRECKVGRKQMHP